MSKIQNVLKPLAEHKGVIIRRTIIVCAVVVGVTATAGLFKVTPTEEAIQLVEDAAKATHKAADAVAKAAQ